MSAGDDNFFARWSRRKQAVAAAEARGSAGCRRKCEPPGRPSRPSPASRRGSCRRSREPAEAKSAAEPCPGSRISTADSDLSAFLRKGVPAALKNAAMRQMWSLDPAIRDHVGPAEYAWDFNTPGFDGGFRAARRRAARSWISCRRWAVGAVGRGGRPRRRSAGGCAAGRIRRRLPGRGRRGRRPESTAEPRPRTRRRRAEAEARAVRPAAGGCRADGQAHFRAGSACNIAHRNTVHARATAAPCRDDDPGPESASEARLGGNRRSCCAALGICPALGFACLCAGSARRRRRARRVEVADRHRASASATRPLPDGADGQRRRRRRHRCCALAANMRCSASLLLRAPDADFLARLSHLQGDPTTPLGAGAHRAWRRRRPPRRAERCGANISTSSIGVGARRARCPTPPTTSPAS